MVSRRGSDSEEPSRRSRPATTPEGRENQLVNLAIERAEQQLRDGTASAQVITHFLKLGSSREFLEQERIRYDTELLRVKSEALKAQKDMQGLYENAIKAMRSYSGFDEPEEERYDD